MVFTTGANIAANIVDLIIDSLIATDYWHNVDTTWNTSNKTSNNARRVVAYGPAGGAGKGNTILSLDIIGGTTVPVTSELDFNVDDKIVIGSGNTAEVRVVTAVAAGELTIDAAVNTTHFSGEPVREIDFEIYFAIEVINESTGIYYTWPNWYYTKGLRYVFSKTWNAATHTYPTTNPTTDFQSTIINFEGRCCNANASANLATMMITYYLWTDSTGFVIMCKPEPDPTDNEQESFITVLERNTNKEYADGFTNFWLYTTGNIRAIHYDGTNTNVVNRCRSLLRPFAFQYPDGAGLVSTGMGGANGGGITFSPLPSYYAYKSAGNGKVYYIRPIIHNQGNQFAPIFQTDMFFLWSENVGLIDGDVIALQGQPIKYLCKALDSPDSTNRLTYAIKYLG